MKYTAKSALLAVKDALDQGFLTIDPAHMADGIPRFVDILNQVSLALLQRDDLIQSLEYANNVLKNIARGMPFSDLEATCAAIDIDIRKAKGE